jgi:pilus assembly protein CpaC
MKVLWSLLVVFSLVLTPIHADPSLKAQVATVQVVKGRSQILKFDQPITRVSVADPAIVELLPLAPDQLLLNGKQRGVTSLIVWDENGQEGLFDVTVRNDTSELLSAIQELSPDEKLQARVTDDSVVLMGQASSSVVIEDIRQLAGAYGYRKENFVDLTDTPAPQVSLKVRIIEASRQVTRNLKTSFNSASGNLNVTRLANPTQLVETALSNNRLPAILPANPGNLLQQLGGVLPTQNLGIQSQPLRFVQGSNTVGGLTGGVSPVRNFDVAWDFLESTGKVRILAEPTLVVTHGRSANFLAGGEFPFVGSTDQNGGPIVSFREYGIKLNFTPWIALRSGRIEMKVQPEVSSVDSSNCVTTSGASVCGLIKRSSVTTVDLKNGETLVISGILTKDDEERFQKIPFVADIPVIGSLFKNASTNRSERELVVAITPTIITP